MICSTDINTSKVSVDFTLSSFMEPCFNLVRGETGFHGMTASAAFLNAEKSGYGYVIAENNQKTNVLFSGGMPSNGGFIHATQDWVGIFYVTGSTEFVIEVEKGTDVAAQFDMLLPTNVYMTAASRLAGVLPQGYAVVGDTVFESYSANSLPSFPKSKYATFQGGRMLSCYGFSTGSLTLDFTPSNRWGGLVSLLNPLRSNVEAVAFAHDEGARIVSRSEYDQFIDNFCAGLAVRDSLVCNLFQLPASIVKSTSGKLYVAVRVSKSGVLRYKPRSFLFVKSVGGPLSTRIWEFGSGNDMAADYYTTTDETFNSILREYDGKYDELMAAELERLRESVDSIEGLLVAEWNSCVDDFSFDWKSDIGTTVAFTSLPMKKQIQSCKKLTTENKLEECERVLSKWGAALKTRKDETGRLRLEGDPAVLKQLFLQTSNKISTQLSERLSNFEKFIQDCPPLDGLKPEVSIKQRYTYHYSCWPDSVEDVFFLYPSAYASQFGGLDTSAQWTALLNSQPGIPLLSAKTEETDDRVVYFGEGLTGSSLYSMAAYSVDFSEMKIENGKLWSHVRMIVGGVPFFHRSAAFNQSAVDMISTSLIKAVVSDAIIKTFNVTPTVYAGGHFGEIDSAKFLVLAAARNANLTVTSEELDQIAIRSVEKTLYTERAAKFICDNNYVFYSDGQSLGDSSIEKGLVTNLATRVRVEFDAALADVRMPSTEGTLTTISKAIDDMLANVNAAVINWLISALKDSGALGAVGFVGRSVKGEYLSLDSLGRLTDFTIGEHFSALKGALESVRDTKKVVDGKATAVFALDTADRENINTLILELERVVAKTEGKVWAEPKNPVLTVRKEHAYELLPFYTDL